MKLTRIAATVAGVGALAAVGVPGAAEARPVSSQYVAQHCIGLSPNVVDIPYNGGVRVDQDGPGKFAAFWGSASLFGYTTDGTLNWHNLRTGQKGRVPVTIAHNLSGNSYVAEVDSGAGPVRITTTGLNRGLLTFGAPRCSGVANIR
ncbi:hypothetical protein [Gordonia phthalatica]|uniref:hypothetical protein n=1 Tax=Gordonia phthalatica TaxID=1136941 RepID=UPI000783A0BE|nr:hypothetical protein [Gordonia phthalatica]